jgi:hypothetical protein
VRRNLERSLGTKGQILMISNKCRVVIFMSYITHWSWEFIWNEKVA